MTHELNPDERERANELYLAIVRRMASRFKAPPRTVIRTGTPPSDFLVRYLDTPAVPGKDWNDPRSWEMTRDDLCR